MNDITLTANDDIPLHEVQDARVSRFQAAVSFLRQTAVPQSQTKLIDLPWFLVLGSANTGKTQLLSESGLDFLLRKKNPKQNERFCDWWATAESVWLDVNPDYALFDPMQREHETAWLLFLDNVQQAKKAPLGGVLLVVALEDLLLPGVDSQTTVFDRLAARLQELSRCIQGIIPVYIAITHCQHLLGFIDYFDDLNAAERQQAWGVRFTHTQQSKQRLADSFELEFADILTRLHARVIMRLQQERTLAIRALIKDFPLQVESLKRPLAVLLQALVSVANDTQKFVIRGLYWTAFAEAPQAHDRLMQPLGQRFALQPHYPEQRSAEYSSYFIEDFFEKNILQDSEEFQHYRQHVSKPSNQYWYYGIIAAAGLLVLLTTFGGIHRFAVDMRTLNQAEAAIAAYQTLRQEKSNSNITDWLPALNQLEQANQLLNSTSMPWLLRHLGRTHDITTYANSAYQAALRDMLANTLTAELNTALASTTTPDLASLYGNLKVYLMLGEPKHYQADYIQSWLLNHWQQQKPLSQEEQQALANHLSAALKAFNQPLTLDAGLIAKARSRLISADIPELTLALLTNNTTIPLAPVILELQPSGQPSALLQAPMQRIVISGIYTHAAFMNIYSTVIPQVAHALSQGDWVLGEHSSMGPVTNNLLQVIRNFYVEAYQHTWDKALGQISLGKLTDYQSASDALAQFANPNSNIQQLFKTIADNTNITYGRMPTPISQHFAPLNNALAHLGKTGHDDWINFATQLQDLSHASDRYVAALDAAKTHALLPGAGDSLYNLSQMAEAAPAPLNQWMSDLLAQSWQLVLNDASQTINVAWQATVVPSFNAKLAGKYPLVANSSEEALPTDFANFFGLNGTVDNFYQHYLLNLVTLQNGQVQARDFNGAHLALSPEAWQMFSRIMVIHQGWFHDPENPFNLQLALTNQTMPNDIDTMDVTIAGQHTSFAPNYQTSMPIHWPNNSANTTIQIDVSGSGQTGLTQNYQGFWALYRWLDTAVSVQMKDPQTLQANFIEGPWQVSYELKTTNGAPIPLAPEVIHGLSIASALI